MSGENTTNRPSLYYTRDHEWVEFRDGIAYTGVCMFKLLGFREIQQITFTAAPGFKKQGEVLASIRYKDYKIEAHMPVDGVVDALNEELCYGNRNILLQQSESNAWIARIIPSDPGDTRELMLPRQYHTQGKDRYARQASR